MPCITSSATLRLFLVAAAASLPATTPAAAAPAAAAAAWSFVPRPSVLDAPRAASRAPRRAFAPAVAAGGLDRRPGGRPCDLTMKVSKGKSRKTPRKSSAISVAHSDRVRSAGRVGTKRYVDPTRVFVGNLPYDADEDDVHDFLSEYLGPRVVDLNVESVKIVRDWRTGRSRGYGFVQFLDPMMATTAMDGLNGRPFMGRRINLSQGQRRKDPDRIWIKKRERAAAMAAAAAADDAEGAVIDSALDEAEEGEGAGLSQILSVEDFDEADDRSLFADDGEGDDDDDDEEFEFDGVFEEVYKKELSDGADEDSTTNRAQRREASRGKKKRKLPHKGFG